METRLVALKLVLDQLDVPLRIETLDDRKRVQKAIYLAQRAGVTLGYSFGWYLRGPYSTSLTRDYFPLAGEWAAGDRSAEDFELPPTSAEKLRRISAIMQPACSFGLGVEAWLELVASYDYLRSLRGLSDAEARQVLEKEKPGLAPHGDSALEALRLVGLATYETD